jgi:hypothetical protein
MEIETITLVSYEGENFQVPSIILNYSTVLSSKKNLDFPEINEKYHLAQLEVDTETLSLIVDYFSHYSFSPPTTILESTRSLSLLKKVPPWDVQFITSIGDEVLTKLIHACLKLDLTPLLQLVCLCLASRYKDLVTIEKQHCLSFHEYHSKEVEIYMKSKYSWATKDSMS